MQLEWLRGLRTRLCESPGPEVGCAARAALAVVRLVYFACREFRKNLGFERSASLTFATLLSLVPVSVLLMSFAARIGLGSKIETYVKDKILPLIAPSPEILGKLRSGLEDAREQFAFDQAETFYGLIAIVALVIAALGVILTAERNFNRIWQTRSTRSYMQKFAVFWVILTISPFVLLASTGVTEFLVSENSDMAKLVKQFALLDWLYGFVLPASLGLIGFTVLYVFLPSLKVDLLSALVGGSVAAILWEFSKRGFAFYVERSENLYGQLAIIPLFLVWVYLNWVITLFGCVLAYVHQNFRVFSEIGHRLERVSPVPVAYVGVLLLEQVARAFRGHRSFPTAKSVGKDLGVSPDKVEAAAAFLVRGGFLAATTEPEGYALCRAPEEISLRPVLETLPQEDFPDELSHLSSRASQRGGHEGVGVGALRAFQAGRRSYLASFAETTLADLIAEVPVAADAVGGP
jgi:membrane protein